MSTPLEPASTGQNSPTMMSDPPIPQRTSPFEELPIEIQIMILYSMPSPKDLYATIRASPTALGAFLGCREAILLSVLKRHISPEIFCHYLALLTMPNYAHFNFVAAFDPDLGYDETDPYEVDDCEEFRWQAWRDVAQDFFKDIIITANHVRSGGPMEEHRWCTLKTSKIPTEVELEAFKKNVQSLFTMYGTVQRFAKDYQAFSFNVAQGRQADLQKLEFSNPPGDATQWPPLSPGEQVRLHRGLIRYELCCRLLGIPFMLRTTDISMDHDFDGDDPYCIIKDLMESWELQEILAIRAYVQRKYDLLHLNTQNEFLVDVQSLDKRIRGSASAAVKDGENTENTVSESEECLFPVTCASRWRQSARVIEGSTDCVESMSRLGLLVLQYVLRSDSEDKHNLHTTITDWTFWRPQRCCVGRDECVSLSDWVYPQGHRRGRANVSLTGANPVFRAVQFQKGKLDWRDDESLEKGARRLQELGWVFWEDRSRISALRLPRDEDDQRRRKYQVARHFRDNIHRQIQYEADNIIEQVGGAHVTNADWDSIIVPKYGFRPLGVFEAPPRSKTPWLDVW